MTFDQFQASRTEVADLEAAIGSAPWGDDPTPGFLYGGQTLHIERTPEAYRLTLICAQWETADLEDLERKLYAFAVGEGFIATETVT